MIKETESLSKFFVNYVQELQKYSNFLKTKKFNRLRKKDIFPKKI